VFAAICHCNEAAGEYRRTVSRPGNREDAGTCNADQAAPLGKADSGRCFDDLFNLVHDPAFLITAWHRVRGNKGGRAAGFDGVAPCSIESLEVILAELRALLKARCFRPTRVREKSIPKAGGKVRRLGRPPVFPAPRRSHGSNGGLWGWPPAAVLTGVPRDERRAACRPIPAEPD